MQPKEHPTVQVVTDIRGGQVCWLVPVVIDAVVPMCECDREGGHADVRKVTRRVAHGLAINEPTTVMNCSNVGLVANHPDRQTGTHVGKALPIQGDLDPLVEEPRVASHTQPPILHGILQIEDTPILLERGIIDMSAPEQAKIDVHPGGDGEYHDEGGGDQGTHVAPHKLRFNDVIVSQGVSHHMAEKEGDGTVHGVRQTAAVLLSHSKVDLGNRQHNLPDHLKEDPQCVATEALPRGPKFKPSGNS